jgi:hypothetical protein
MSLVQKRSFISIIRSRIADDAVLVVFAVPSLSVDGTPL